MPKKTTKNEGQEYPNRKYEKMFCSSGAFQTVSCREEHKCENKSKVFNCLGIKSYEIKTWYPKTYENLIFALPTLTKHYEIKC